MHSLCAVVVAGVVRRLCVEPVVLVVLVVHESHLTGHKARAASASSTVQAVPGSQFSWPREVQSVGSVSPLHVPACSVNRALSVDVVVGHAIMVLGWVLMVLATRVLVATSPVLAHPAMPVVLGNGGIKWKRSGETREAAQREVVVLWGGAWCFAARRGGEMEATAAGVPYGRREGVREGAKRDAGGST